ncbi:hypothetical protein B0H15DRAFT_603439 [Mycena belliarum]|uniref:Uncharacterized protein n=1 Tax=Mycena belliarum TaxID=1033014 RepID=A0AAD6TSG8_9AGAR|nr:hypothetical protein B0H15DRAFT_603439 [Mycena belliae]
MATHIRREWNLPAQLPQIWLETLDPPKPIVPQSPPPPSEVAKESPPPIPDHLAGRECLYGWIITDELMEEHRAMYDPDEHPPNCYMFRAYKHNKICSIANQFRFRLFIDDAHYGVEGSEDIAWVSYTKHGHIMRDQVPSAERLARFEEAVGIRDKVKWIDAGLPIGGYH